MTDTITRIPLDKLTAWEGNVRKTQSKAGIDELAASIETHGLLQSLVVRKQGKARFAVVAGQRRLAALTVLREAGKIRSDFEVPCQVLDAEANATEISLAENVVRENMHPADQFEAFRDLVDKGLPIADVAARFGVTETIVKQRLKLGRVSSLVLKAYRDEELTLEDVMAFAITDDHDAQEHVLSELETRHGPRDIRDALTENEIPATDKRVRYVTLPAYEKAGGALNRDLFSTDDAGVFIADAGLLNRLVSEKLERAARAVRKEGWKWVETRNDFGYDERAQFQRRHAEPVPLPADEQAELEALQQEYETLEAQWAESGDEERPERLDDVGDRIESINDERELAWPPETLAIAGAVVTIGHDGKAAIERGLVRPEDAPKKTREPKAAGADAGDATTTRAPYSASLIESLTAQKSAAISAALLQRPDIALASLVHALACQAFLHGPSGGHSLEIAARQQSLRRVEGSTALTQIEAARETWGHTIPGDPEALWQWCLEQNREQLLDLLAVCVAGTVNAVQLKADRPGNPRLHHAGQLATALGLDMTAWFTPTAGNYFTRVGKPQILEALQEARNAPPAPAWEKLAKAELAALAEREIAGTGWLPELLRTSAN